MPKRAARKTLNTAQARKLCLEWQKRLRLQDWKLEVSVVRAADMSLNEAVAEYSCTLERKTAIIRLLDPIDNETLGLGVNDRDMEKDLVHEIVHCHFAPFMEHRPGPKRTAQEQAIDLWSDCVVDIFRGAK